MSASLSVANAQCIAGYYGPNEGSCTSCPGNTISTAGSTVKTPVHVPRGRLDTMEAFAFLFHARRRRVVIMFQLVLTYFLPIFLQKWVLYHRVSNAGQSVTVMQSVCLMFGMCNLYLVIWVVVSQAHQVRVLHFPTPFLNFMEVHGNLDMKRRHTLCTMNYHWKYNRPLALQGESMGHLHLKIALCAQLGNIKVQQEILWFDCTHCPANSGHTLQDRQVSPLVFVTL